MLVGPSGAIELGRGVSVGVAAFYHLAQVSQSLVGEEPVFMLGQVRRLGFLILRANLCVKELPFHGGSQPLEFVLHDIIISAGPHGLNGGIFTNLS